MSQARFTLIFTAQAAEMTEKRLKIIKIQHAFDALSLEIRIWRQANHTSASASIFKTKQKRSIL